MLKILASLVHGLLHRSALPLFAAVVCVFFSGFPISATEASALDEKFRLPSYFEQNVGQFDPSIRFVAQTPNYSVRFYADHFTAGDAPWSLSEANAEKAEIEVTTGTQFSVSFGHSDLTRVTGEDPLGTHINYFVGKDPLKWKTDVPVFKRIRYRAIEKGRRLSVLFY